MENSCSLTLAGIRRDCAPSRGGVRRVLVAIWDDIEKVTAELGRVSAIKMKTGKQFFAYDFRSRTASLTSTLEKNAENGTTNYKSDLVMGFTKMDAAKRVEINALVINDVACIVEDMNGKYWYLGKDEPVQSSAADGGTGTALADKNGYGITLTDNSVELPLEVAPEIIGALLVPSAAAASK